MSKMIAVNGPPSCGKSTIALKLAQEVYSMTHKPILYLSPDVVIPSLGVIFPTTKQTKLHSLGKALDKTDIYQEDVMSQTVTTKFMENFGYLGFKTGEDQFTYPMPTDDKVIDLFQSMKQIASYIFIDCDRNQDDLISSLGRGHANHLIQIVNPDLRSMSFYGAGLLPENAIKVMNIMAKDLYLPIKETANHYKGIDFKVPYSRAVKQQGINGTLPQYVNDAVYRLALSNIAKVVL